MINKVAVIVGLWLLAGSLAFATPVLAVYIHGQPYTGDYLVQDKEIYVEEQAVLNALNLPEGFTIPKGSSIQWKNQIFVLLSRLAQLTDNAYQMNWTTGIADVYSPVVQRGGATVATSAPKMTSETDNSYAEPFPVLSARRGLPLQDFRFSYGDVALSPPYYPFYYAPIYYPTGPVCVRPPVVSSVSPIDLECLYHLKVCDGATLLSQQIQIRHSFGL